MPSQYLPSNIGVSPSVSPGLSTLSFPDAIFHFWRCSGRLAALSSFSEGWATLVGHNVSLPLCVSDEQQHWSSLFPLETIAREQQKQSTVDFLCNIHSRTLYCCLTYRQWLLSQTCHAIALTQSTTAKWARHRSDPFPLPNEFYFSLRVGASLTFFWSNNFDELARLSTG